MVGSDVSRAPTSCALTLLVLIDVSGVRVRVSRDTSKTSYIPQYASSAVQMPHVSFILALICARIAGSVLRWLCIVVVMFRSVNPHLVYGQLNKIRELGHIGGFAIYGGEHHVTHRSSPLVVHTTYVLQTEVFSYIDQPYR
jgi:hypothetical protein